MVEVRDAELPNDLNDVARLWHDYLAWGYDELESRHGFRLPVDEAIERDVATIGKLEPPDGRLLLAFVDGIAIGTAALRRIGPDTAEIKRMWVDPAHRGRGIGGAMLDRLLEAATDAGYARIVLDSPDFMTAALELYRSRDSQRAPAGHQEDGEQAHWARPRVEALVPLEIALQNPQ
jgi:putative acetyltransferase